MSCIHVQHQYACNATTADSFILVVSTHECFADASTCRHQLCIAEDWLQCHVACLCLNAQLWAPSNYVMYVTTVRLTCSAGIVVSQAYCAISYSLCGPDALPRSISAIRVGFEAHLCDLPPNSEQEVHYVFDSNVHELVGVF